ncbi:unnamed protein product [Boreogadus saida]
MRSEAGGQRVLQVDLKMESFPETLGSRWMAWQVEYPGSRSTTQEAETEVRLALEDLAAIVPLAMAPGGSPEAEAWGPAPSAERLPRPAIGPSLCVD